MSYNFAIIGIAGYIAPRHLKAIKETGHNVIAAYDPHDSVGILDSYFPESKFFTEFERFDRFAEKMKRMGEEQRIHYVSICSPNYLHDAHIRFALRIGANTICEKPLVINPWNIDALKELELEYHKKVFTVLQLRLHPTIMMLKKTVSESNDKKMFDVQLSYITSRGAWYASSWKNDIHKSGGLATNIGIHFFDMLIWIFGEVKNYEIAESQPHKISGKLELARANVTWKLSIDPNDLPREVSSSGKKTFRKLAIDGDEIEFSEGFTDLHTEVYKQIFLGHGFTLDDARPSIELVSKLRTYGHE